MTKNKQNSLTNLSELSIYLLVSTSVLRTSTWSAYGPELGHTSWCMGWGGEKVTTTRNKTKIYKKIAKVTMVRFRPCPTFSTPALWLNLNGFWTHWIESGCWKPLSTNKYFISRGKTLNSCGAISGMIFECCSNLHCLRCFFLFSRTRPAVQLACNALQAEPVGCIPCNMYLLMHNTFRCERNLKWR